MNLKKRIYWWLKRKNKRPLVIAFFLLMIFAVFAIYFITFYGELSTKQEIWGYFGDYIGGFFGALSFGIVIYLFYETSQNRNFINVYHFLKNFRSKKMGNDIKILYDFYNYKNYKKNTNEYENEIIKKENIIKRYPMEQKNKSEIFYARRNVSYFYLYLSIFLQNNKIKKDLFFSLWSFEELNSILNDIIIPCENSLGGYSNKIEHFNYLLNEAIKYENNQKNNNEKNQIAIGKRLRQVRKHFNLSQRKFSIFFNIEEKILYQLEIGKLVIPDSIIIKLIEKGININWLFTGKGKMIITTVGEINLKQYKTFQLGIQLKKICQILNTPINKLSTNIPKDKKCFKNYEEDKSEIPIELVSILSEANSQINKLMTKYINFALTKLK